MDCSQNICQKTQSSGQGAVPSHVVEAAQALACLLTETVELQDFARLARNVQTDCQVNEILGRMNGYFSVDTSENVSYTELEERLESLPVMKEYHMAEQAARGIFAAVDQAISDAAGLPFALNAQPGACG